MKKPYKYSGVELKKVILADAKALGVPEKWAGTIATETAKHVDAWVKKRGAVTAGDVRRVAGQKLQTLHPDIAYIYKNRDKIV